MARRNKLGAITILVLLALTAAACGSSSKGATGGSTSSTASSPGARGNVNGQLVLGALLPQSGDLSVIYKSLKTPITMAVAEINAAGGVNGKPVVIKDGDGGTKPDVDSI